MRLEQYQIIIAPTEDLHRWRRALINKYEQAASTIYSKFSKADRATLNAIYTELWRRGVYGGTK